MKQIIIIFSLLNIFFSQHLFAISSGTTGLNFLKIATDTRGIAMGETGTASSEDIGALYWNPAGLSHITEKKLYCMYNQWFQNIKSQYIAYGMPLNKNLNNKKIKNYGTFGASIQYLSINDIQGYDTMGDTTNKLNAYDIALTISHARRLYKQLFTGLNLKYLSEKLDNYSASSYALDLGLMLKTLHNINYGFMIQNLGTGIKFINTQGKLPLTIRCGVSYKKILFSQLLTTSFDIIFPNDNDTCFGLGFEYWVKNIIAVRAGYKSGIDIGSGLRAGIGIDTNLFLLDYAFSAFGDLGNTHRIGLHIYFGDTKKREKLNKMFKKASQLYKQNYFAETLRELNNILDIKSDYQPALKMLKEISDTINRSLSTLQAV